MMLLQIYTTKQTALLLEWLLELSATGLSNPRPEKLSIINAIFTNILTVLCDTYNNPVYK